VLAEEEGATVRGHGDVRSVSVQEHFGGGAAVASRHNQNRMPISVAIGEEALTIWQPRLKKVRADPCPGVALHVEHEQVLRLGVLLPVDRETPAVG